MLKERSLALWPLDGLQRAGNLSQLQQPDELSNVSPTHEASAMPDFSRHLLLLTDRGKKEPALKQAEPEADLARKASKA